MCPAGRMNVLLILPALTEAKSPFWRPIKYSLFPPLGLATLAAPQGKPRRRAGQVGELGAAGQPGLSTILVQRSSLFLKIS